MCVAYLNDEGHKQWQFAHGKLAHGPHHTLPARSSGSGSVAGSPISIQDITYVERVMSNGISADFNQNR